MKSKSTFPYVLLGLAIIAAILALTTSIFIFKSGTAGIGILILLVLTFQKEKPSKDHWFIIGAFLFSILGDWFLSNMNGDPLLFSKGIVLFFLAHVGYLLFSVYNGSIRWKFTGIVLTAFLIFYFLAIYPAIEDTVLMMAALIYLIVSCVSFGAALGIKDIPEIKRPYVFGIFLILFSDTIIALKEFVGYDALNFLILPTYYLAHVTITYALIRRADVLAVNKQ